MQKKTPIWPLYVADALMFLTVLAATVPNIRLHEPLGTAQTAILVGIVFISMLLVLTPYVLNCIAEIKLAKINVTKSKIQSEEQVRTIFADLRTLRNSLIEQMENTQTARNLSESLAQDLMSEKMKVKKLGDAVEAISQKVKSDTESIESFKLILDEFKSQIDDANDAGMLEPRVSEVEKDAKKLNDDFAEIKLQITSLIDEIQSALNSETDKNPAKNSDDFFEDSDENLNDESDQSSNDSVESDEDLDEDKSKENVDEIKKSEESLPDTEVEEPIPASKDQPNWSGMIDKALSNSQAFSTRSVVSRFIEKNKAGDAPDISEEVESPIGEKIGQEDVSESETVGEVENSEEYKEIAAEVDEAKKNNAAQAALFDDSQIPETKKAKPARNGDTAIVANAFLGIGNKPFVRGSSAGLSQEKGVAMQMLEIGKWQWICEALPTDPIKITIWLNDQKPSQLGEIVLNPGETLDVDLNF